VFFYKLIHGLFVETFRGSNKRMGVHRTALRLVNKNVLINVALGCSSLIGLSHYAKHTFLMNYYVDKIELKGNNTLPIMPSESLRHLFEQVVKELDEKELGSERTPVSLFMVSGMRPCTMGTVGTHLGGQVGLPAFFEFRNIEDVRNNVSITIRTPANPSDGENLAKDEDEIYNCFLLSDNAKKYAIVHEVLQITTFKVYYNTVLPYSLVFCLERLLRWVEGQVVFQTAGGQALSVTGTWLLGLLLWRFLHITINNMCEADVEEQLVTLGKDYILGGIEYYTKQIQRNSLKAEFKNHNVRVFKALSDLVRSVLAIRTIPPIYKKLYLEGHLELIDKELPV